jgi:hypothetical protein
LALGNVTYNRGIPIVPRYRLYSRIAIINIALRDAKHSVSSTQARLVGYNKGYMNHKSKPTALTRYTLSVIYSNGKADMPIIWATSREKAISIVERSLRHNGWLGVVE